MSETATTSDAQTLEQLQSLEERILGAIRLLHDARQARQAAEAEATRLRAELQARDAEAASRSSEAAGRDAEIASLRKERDEVHRRVERLLAHVNALAAE